MNTVTRIIKKASTQEKFPVSSLPEHKPIPRANVPKLQRESSLPRIDVDRPLNPHSPLCRSSSAPGMGSNSKTDSKPPSLQSLVLFNENFESRMNDRSQKLLTNTKKVRGLRSFLWVKPKSSSAQASFVSQLLPSLIINLGSLSIGLALGFSSVFLPWVVQEVEDPDDDILRNSLPLNVSLPIHHTSLTPELGSWIASIFWLGAFLGGFLGRWLTPRFGSRVSVVLMTVPDLLGWILLATPSSFPLLMLGRICTGISAGGYFPNIQRYVKEVCSRPHLPLLSLLPLPTIGLGVLLSYSLGLLLLPTQVCLVSAVIPTLLAVTLTCCTEDSPLWLVTADRDQEAVSALGKLRGGNAADAVSEVLQMQHKMRKHDEPLDLLEGIQTIIRKHMDVFATINTLFFFLAFSGKFSVEFYATQLIQNAGGVRHEQLCAVLIAVTYVIGCMAFIVLGKKLSRKTLYLTSSVVSGVFLTLFGLSVYHYNHYVKPSSLIPLFSLSIFMFFAPLGLSSLPFTMLAESFPSEVRPLAGSITLSLACLQMLLVTKLQITLQVMAGLHTVVWLQAGVCFLAALVSLHILPETKTNKLLSLVEYDKFAGLRKDRTQPWVIPITH